MTTFNEIFKKLDENKFDDSNCFLCGTDLHENNRSQEHVIPKWIQRRFNLWNQKIILLNGSSIDYRYLTIPCCKNCNNKYLKRLEDKLINAIDSGFDSLKKLDRNIIFYWLGKIYFGLMYKELFLHLNQKNHEEGTIINSDYIKRFEAHYLFLQGIRGMHQFNDFFPASIFIVETLIPENEEAQWDFIDNHLKMFISCRIGGIGIIAALQDGGATQGFEKVFKEYFQFPLHPLQFRELTAKILYQLLLLNRVPKYISINNNECIETFQNPLGGYSVKPIFDEGNNDEYAKLLASLIGEPLYFVNPKPGLVRTWIKDEFGNPIKMDVKENNSN